MFIPSSENSKIVCKKYSHHETILVTLVTLVNANKNFHKENFCGRTTCFLAEKHLRFFWRFPILLFSKMGQKSYRDSTATEY